RSNPLPLSRSRISLASIRNMTRMPLPPKDRSPLFRGTAAHGSAALGPGMDFTRTDCVQVSLLLTPWVLRSRGVRAASSQRRRSRAMAHPRSDIPGCAQAAASLYLGEVMHARLKPMAHRFTYQVLSLFIDLDRLDEADRLSPMFGVNRPAPFSFWESDHGPCDGSSL